MPEINVGDVVRVSTSPGFKDVAGVLTDPTTVSLVWRASGGTATTWVYPTDAQIVKDGVGLYHADIPVTLTGLHYFRWVGTGAIAAAEEGTFRVVAFPGELDTYATLDDVVGLFETIPLAARQARLMSLLRTATSEVINECGGRDYFRHPVAGTTSWYGDVARGNRSRGDYGILHAHGGIVSLDSLEVSQDQGGSFATVTATDYVLRGSDPDSAEPPGLGEPYFHVVFTGIGTIAGLPRGVNVARLTGIRGWPAIPAALVEATAERARQLAYADPSYSGNVPGDSEYGSGPLPMRWPQTLYNFLTAERHRFFCHV